MASSPLSRSVKPIVTATNATTPPVTYLDDGSKTERPSYYQLRARHRHNQIAESGAILRPHPEFIESEAIRSKGVPQARRKPGLGQSEAGPDRLWEETANHRP